MMVAKLYIKQLLDNYKCDVFSDQYPVQHYYTVKYRFSNDPQDSYRVFEHNEGIDCVIDYIRELEKKIDELQYVEKIINLVKAENCKSRKLNTNFKR